MPRLLFFVPAEKALIERDDSSLSLISVIGGITVNVTPDGKDLPEDAGIPFRWAVAAMWLRQPDDEDKAFEQRVDVVSPSNKVTGGAVSAFTMSRRTHYNVVRGEGFPVAQPGQYHLRLSLRETGKDAEWEVVSEYPLEIIHNPSDENLG